jgi:hypothetical protein
MDQNTTNSQNPYASPRGDTMDVKIDAHLPTVSESPIHYSGIVKPEEVIAASKLALRGSWIARRHALTKAAVFFVVACLILLQLFGVFSGNLPLIVFSLLLLGVFGCSVFYRAISLKIKIRDMQQRNLGCYQHTDGIIREEGFEAKSADGASLILWSAFKGLRVGEEVAVLYYAKHQGYCFFSRSKFKSEVDWQRLIGFLKSRFPYGSL